MASSRCSRSRALLTNPELLLLDEPTEGLAPVVVHQLRDVLGRVKQTGLTIVLVEQNLPVALSLADELIVLRKGSSVGTEPGSNSKMQPTSATCGSRSKVKDLT